MALCRTPTPTHSGIQRAAVEAGFRLPARCGPLQRPEAPHGRRQRAVTRLIRQAPPSSTGRPEETSGHPRPVLPVVAGGLPEIRGRRGTGHTACVRPSDGRRPRQEQVHSEPQRL